MLVQYDFEGSNLAASASVSEITGSGFGYTGVGETNWFTGYNSDIALRGTSWSTNDALEAYFRFAATIHPGFIVNVTNITFYEMRSSQGPTRWVARYSTDSNAWHTIGVGNNATDWGAIDIVDDGQPLDLTGTVYFRIYATNAQSHSGTWRLDDVTLNGEERIDNGTRVIRSRDFDGTHLDTWPTTTNVSGGTIQSSTEKQVSGARSLGISGSVAGNTNQNIVLANTDITDGEEVSLYVAFAATQVDLDDDLWLDLSYDNGTNWNAPGSVKLVDGSNQHSVAFGATTYRTVAANPWIVGFSAGHTQVAVRIRFEESGPPHNTNDHYYVDDVKLVGILEPPVNAPLIENYGAPTDVSETQATVRAHVQDGYPYPEVTLYWGPADGQTNSSSWSHETEMGTNSWGLVTNTLTGLSPGTVYYYRFYAENSNGYDWANSTSNFNTTATILAAGLFLDSLGIGTAQPLSIDRDGNGLSDVWEIEFLGGLGQDINVDDDGDGVTNLYEQIAGTDPNNSNSFMRLVSVDLSAADSDNITISIAGGGSRGSTQFGDVGDKNARQFTVRTADSGGAAKTFAASIVDTGGGTNTWVDTNMVNEVSNRYYDITVAYGGQSYSNVEEWAAYVQDRSVSSKYIICVPVNMPGGGENNLDSRVGDQLARGLHPATITANADKLRRVDAGGAWKEYFLITNSTTGEVYWYDEDTGTNADLTVTPGMVFWVVRGSGSALRDNTVFAGKSFLESEAVNFNFNTNYGGWTMFGWPLARKRSHSSGNSSPNQLGFYAAGIGGTTGQDEFPNQQGDEIWIWEDNTWKYTHWLIGNSGQPLDGRWWNTKQGLGLVDFHLEPGEAFYYRHRVNQWGGTNFTWQPENP